MPSQSAEPFAFDNASVICDSYESYKPPAFRTLPLIEANAPFKSFTAAVHAAVSNSQLENDEPFQSCGNGSTARKNPAACAFIADSDTSKFDA